MNIKNLFMHLTNFSLNKNSERFIAPEGKNTYVLNVFLDEFYKDSQASKRLLSQIYKSLLQKGKDVRHLKK